MIPIPIDQKLRQDMYAAAVAAEDIELLCPEDQTALKRPGRDQREATIKMIYFLWTYTLDVQDLKIQQTNGLQTIDHTCTDQLPTTGNENGKNHVRKMIKQRQKLMMNQKTVVHPHAQNWYVDLDAIEKTQELYLRVTPTMWIRVELDHQTERE